MRLMVPLRSHSPADHVREALDRADKRLASLRGAGSDAVDILDAFDFVVSGLAEIEQAGADVKPEQSRLDTLFAKFRRMQNLFLREVGGALREERASTAPGRERWWWFVDEIVAEERKEKLIHLLKRSLVVVAVLLVATFVYDRFIAPPEYVREAMRYTGSGESLVDQGDLLGALPEFEAGAVANPDDAGIWVWIGVVNSELGDTDAAEDAFDRARALADNNVDFLLKRCQTYQRVGNMDAAMDDATAALAEDPSSGWAYVLRGTVFAQMGDFDSALADLDTAGDLASASGDVQLEAYARTQRAMMIQQSMVPRLPTEAATAE